MCDLKFDVASCYEAKQDVVDFVFILFFSPLLGVCSVPELFKTAKPL